MDVWKQNPRAEQYIGDNPFPNFVLTDYAESWAEFRAWAHALQRTWCFRGQREADWSLTTSLDRAAIRHHSITYPDGITSTGYFHVDRDELGRENLVHFRQQANRYANDSPAEGDSGSWFALMQHYGTPTRFLDWSSSPFVAAYFAFEHAAREGKKHSAIWAIDMDWLDKRARELLPPTMFTLGSGDPEARARRDNQLLEECQEAVIVQVNPLKMNARMAAQQGILLCKLRHDVYFSVTLMTMIIHPDIPDQPVLRKLEVPTSVRMDFLRRLEAMNIHSGSLFPDGVPTKYQRAAG